MEEKNDARFDRRISDPHLIKLEARVSRLEEKHEDSTDAIKKLTEKVEALGQSIQRASWIVVGGGGVLYFLISGQLPKILGLAGGTA